MCEIFIPVDVLIEIFSWANDFNTLCLIGGVSMHWRQALEQAMYLYPEQYLQQYVSKDKYLPGRVHISALELHSIMGIRFMPLLPNGKIHGICRNSQHIYKFHNGLLVEHSYYKHKQTSKGKKSYLYYRGEFTSKNWKIQFWNAKHILIQIITPHLIKRYCTGQCIKNPLLIKSHIEQYLKQYHTRQLTLIYDPLAEKTTMSLSSQYILTAAQNEA